MLRGHAITRLADGRASWRQVQRTFRRVPLPPQNRHRRCSTPEARCCLERCCPTIRSAAHKPLPTNRCPFIDQRATPAVIALRTILLIFLREVRPQKTSSFVTLLCMPIQKDIAREVGRARAAKPSAWVTGYERGRYVDEKHINVTTTRDDLPRSHIAAYRALKKAGLTPAQASGRSVGSIRLTVDDNLPLSQAMALVVAALKAADIKVYGKLTPLGKAHAMKVAGGPDDMALKDATHSTKPRTRGRQARQAHATAWVPRPEEITSTAGLMEIAAAVAHELKRSGMTWGDTSRARGRNVRIWSSGTSVRFEVPSRYQGHPSDAQAIVDLVLVGPDRSLTRVGPFAGDSFYDKRFGEAMEQRVRQVLRKGVR